MIGVENVEVRYGSLVAVRELSLTVEAGTMIALTGPSGAGKTSLLWAIAGALSPYAGSVSVSGEPVRNREQATRAGIALVPQGNGLAGILTANENIIAPLIALGRSATDAHRAAGTALASVGLEDSRDHLIEELSGGQQQRVAVARALATDAVVLLADEPTSDVDAVNRERVVALLRARAKAGAVVIMATHDPAAAAQADGEFALDEGLGAWVRVPPLASQALAEPGFSQG